MARSSTTFKKGDNAISRRGTPNKITLDQRAIFDEAISAEDRVDIVKSVFEKAMLRDPKDSAPFAKLIFQYIFSLPKVGHEVTVLDMDEVFTTEVKDAVWREIVAEARLRDARIKETPRLEIIEAQVVGQKTKDNGRRNGPMRKKKESKTRKG